MTCAGLLTSAHAAPGTALQPRAATTPATAPVRLADTGLAVAAPASVDLGSGPAGTTFTARLSPVTVTAGAGVSQWTATVGLSSGFRVTQSGQTWDLPDSRVEYSSGTATGGSVSLSLCLPGQAAGSQTLAQTRTAYRCTGVVSLTSWTVSWRPTLTVRTEATDPAGTYTGTLTHSVA